MIGYRSPKNSDIGPDIVVFYSDIGVKIDIVRYRLRYRTRYHRFLLRYRSFTKAYPFLPPLMSDPISEFAVISGKKTPISGPIFLLHPLLPPPMSANYGCHVRHRLRCEKQYRDIRTSGKKPSISYPMLKNIGIYGCRGFAQIFRCHGRYVTCRSKRLDRHSNRSSLSVLSLPAKFLDSL
jgi:hypothetical protein